MLTAHVKSLKLKLKAQTHVATMGGAHFTLLLLYSYTYIMYIYIYSCLLFSRMEHAEAVLWRK